MVGILIADPRMPWPEQAKEISLLITSVIVPEVRVLTRAGSELMNDHGNSARTYVIVVVVVIFVDDSWDSFFAHSPGRLSLSLWLTQGKSLGSHDSNNRHRH